MPGVCHRHTAPPNIRTSAAAWFVSHRNLQNLPPAAFSGCLATKKPPSVKGRGSRCTTCYILLPYASLSAFRRQSLICVPFNGGKPSGFTCATALSVPLLGRDIPSVLLAPGSHPLRLAEAFATDVLSSSWHVTCPWFTDCSCNPPGNPGFCHLNQYSQI